MSLPTITRPGHRMCDTQAADARSGTNLRSSQRTLGTQRSPAAADQTPATTNLPSTPSRVPSSRARLPDAAIVATAPSLPTPRREQTSSNGQISPGAQDATAVAAQTEGRVRS